QARRARELRRIDPPAEDPASMSFNDVGSQAFEVGAQHVQAEADFYRGLALALGKALGVYQESDEQAGRDITIAGGENDSGGGYVWWGAGARWWVSVWRCWPLLGVRRVWTGMRRRRLSRRCPCRRSRRRVLRRVGRSCRIVVRRLWRIRCRSRHCPVIRVRFLRRSRLRKYWAKERQRASAETWMVLGRAVVGGIRKPSVVFKLVFILPPGKA